MTGAFFPYSGNGDTRTTGRYVSTTKWHRLNIYRTDPSISILCHKTYIKYYNMSIWASLQFLNKLQWIRQSSIPVSKKNISINCVKKNILYIYISIYVYSVVITGFWGPHSLFRHVQECRFYCRHRLSDRYWRLSFHVHIWFCLLRSLNLVSYFRHHSSTIRNRKLIKQFIENIISIFQHI